MKKARKYQTIPEVVEAIAWTGDNYESVYSFALDSGFIIGQRGETLIVPSPDGTFKVSLGNMLVKHVGGIIYNLSQENFFRLYEPHPGSLYEGD